MKRPRVDVNLQPFYKGESKGSVPKSLIVLHETVSHNKKGLDDIKNVAAFMDSTGLEIHGIIDKEGKTGWAYMRNAIFDHAASGDGKVNTRSIGFELVSEIPFMDTNRERRTEWRSPDRRMQLDTVAYWCAWLSTVEDIPLKFSNGAVPGITTHYNVSRTFLGGDGHWDCKPIHSPFDGHFPVLYVVNKAQQILSSVGLT